ncbi:GNAT family N-acetyltransferase [Kribbella sp. NBC_01245]|uniref:GNAT family N-acetyltransferase n=1 Tax=Kribbella sp. NBC_01245 TaxID=2903578 RepID=UPI002E2D289E|nr:GNAT family N-acetyltransferase [Kribbella sp. NBC_01245]
MTDWNGTPVLTTDRLILRTFRRDDLAPYAALNADPEVMRYLGGTALPPAETESIAAYAQNLYAREGLGLLAIERRTDGAFLGMCGLHHLGWYPDDIEIAWRLAHEHWGHGYASEAAGAWLAHGFEVHGFPRVISVTDVPNLRSIAVMRRIGMTLDHEADLEEDGETFRAVIYSITAADWKAGRGLPI